MLEIHTQKRLNQMINQMKHAKRTETEKLITKKQLPWRMVR